MNKQEFKRELLKQVDDWFKHSQYGDDDEILTEYWWDDFVQTSASIFIYESPESLKRRRDLITALVKAAREEEDRREANQP